MYFILVVLVGLWLAAAAADFPPWGDPTAPAHQYLSPYYLERAEEMTLTPNIVTAVLADFRSYDTMFETTVVLTAGLAVFLLLRMYEARRPTVQYWRHVPTDLIIQIKSPDREPTGLRKFEPADPLWTPHDLVIRTACRLLAPFIQVFALYVVAHGHHSPGGGFQGGVILGAGFILLALGFDLRTTQKRLSERTVGWLSPLGVLIYAGIGGLVMLWGGNFLDYAAAAQPLGIAEARARTLGILFVEIGVALAVMATMVLIYYNVSSGGRHKQGL